MKTKEFIEKVEDLGFRVNSINDDSYITIHLGIKIVFEIVKHDKWYEYDVDMFNRTLAELDMISQGRKLVSRYFNEQEEDN